MSWFPSYRKFTNTLANMCSMTTPHGHEAFTWAHLPSPPKGQAPQSGGNYGSATTEIDCNDNYIVTIPGNGVRTLWASHCDTVGTRPEPTKLTFDGRYMRSDGKTILGADDKTGCTIMSMMIRAGCSGTYMFFAGEEVGCVGSKALAKQVDLLDYDHCVSLDRRGYNDIITHQLGDRCCSDAWADAVGEMLGLHSKGILDMGADPTGMFTDSVSFVDVIPECTNISVGYFNQHDTDEYQNVEFAYELCCALIAVVRAGGLPDPIRDVASLEQDDIKYMNEFEKWMKSNGRDIRSDWREDL